MQDFARMLEAEIPRLRRYAHALCGNRMAADDLVQDCLCRALIKRHLFRPESDLRAWLFTMMHHQHINRIRHAWRQPASVGLTEVEPTLIERAAQSEGLNLRDLGRAISTINEEQRQVLLLVCLEEMSYEHVAAILSVPIGTVRSRLSRAREKLRELLAMNPQRSEVL